MIETRERLLASDFPALARDHLQILQVNLGYRCNLSCVHCHVNAGPTRTELMARHTVESVMEFIRQGELQILDLTGGAPEMNPHFKDLVQMARQAGLEVIDRCNLTILHEPGYEDMAEFLAANQVTITASLPCYMEENVAKQRGKGVYDQSVEVLRQLNELGYGRDDKLQLNLVYNPIGPYLPPPQQALQADYKNFLSERYDVVFDELFTITNMPISRFGSVLASQGDFDDYMGLLRDNFSEHNLQTVMCRSLMSVDWQGYVYDCDFNQMLDLPMIVDKKEEVAKTGLLSSDGRQRRHIDELLHLEFQNKPIVVADHCYGCTAGQGSSCGGALEA